MDEATVAAIWGDYCEGGMGIGEISAARGMTYGAVRKALGVQADYAALAAERRKQAPAAVRNAMMKQIDPDKALGLLRAGAGTRFVAAQFGVCTRTLRKRLLPYPDYRRIMAKRGVSKPAS